MHKERRAGNGNLSEGTINEQVVAVRMLEEFLGGPTPACAITKADMLNYKRALMDTPTNYRLRFPGKTLPEAITANAKLENPHKVLSPQTINIKWLTHIGTIMGWCVANDLIEANPARGVKVATKKGKSEPTRVPFNQDDLQRIFGNELFSDPKSFETKQWSLLLALYTGARSSSEIARIKLSDIFQEQSVNVIHLEDASKNVRSKRLVPVHRDLIDLGFLDHVEALRKQGKRRLFWDWEPEDKINRWFLRTFKPQVGISDSRKVFHSFRHSLKTELAKRGVNRDVSDLITGHKDQAESGTYIHDASVTMIAAMNEGLNRANFNLKLPRKINLYV
ncbi:site-specific integrase [Devosia rhodophyticola]|uniref:Site-specific integrase n=1 Tax=Devosia rhodophyticola TaxID=3026423 RepID=A0ABY7YW72_9HYPH|nr:site-specific integrase [Devosia rhodophyticola]WDR05618.1 site-specific integrase [Devosia rhodophyticola]